MNLHKAVASVALAALLLGGVATLGAQSPAPPAVEPPPAPPVPPAPPEPDPDDVVDDFGSNGQQIVRIGQDFTLAEGEEAREVTVIMGNATINGRVRELVVIMGTIQLGPRAVVGRTLTSIAGGVTVAEGAQVSREMVVIGGAVDAPPSFTPGRGHVVINPPFFGTRLNALVPYVTQGVMLGRPIVPSLWWLWGIVGVFFIVYLAVNLLADGPVRAVAALIDEKVLTAFGTGLLALLLVGPISFLLAVSVVGVLVIPVLLCALLAAALVGKVATLRWLGMRVWRSQEQGPMEAAMTFVIGFAIVTLLYMVPILGIIVFALLSVLGLGAATLAFVAAYRREQPPAMPVIPPPPLPPLSVPPLDGGVSDGTQAPALNMSPTSPPQLTSDAYAVSALPRGAFRDRLAAFLLDIILVVLVVAVVWPFDNSPRVIFLWLLVYHIAFWAWKHTTVGGIICQLRIVRVDGVPLTVSDAFIRGLSAIFSVVVLGLGFLWVLRDPERQSWHDKIAGTYVVKVPRNWRA